MSFKLSFSTLACPDWDLQRVLDTAARLGFNGVELRFLSGRSDLDRLPEFTGARLAESRRAITDRNLAIACVDTDVHFHWPDAAKRRENVDEGVRMADLAAALGAPGIRIFGDKIQPGQTREQTRAWTSEGMCALAEKTRGHGVEVWIETHGDFANWHDTREILQAAKCAGVGAVWDPENCYDAYFEKPADGAKALGAYIRHVHYKDIHRDAKGQWIPALMGKGEFPLLDTLNALRRLGYGRFVSFEWEKKWHPEIPDADVALPQFMQWMRTNWKNS